MSNPNSRSQPDTYKGTYWYTGTSDNGGVHTNSGIGNFMFYLLVTGGSGTNDIGNSFSVTGIGLDKADQILYRSETVYLSPTSKYADWRTACINAATDLYGSGSNEVTQVQNAWYAVGIGTAGGSGSGCSTPSGLTSSSITNTSATISWAAVSGAVTYNLQWKASTSSTWTTVTGLATTSRSLTPLTAGTTYQFQVQTVCAAGTSGYSSVASFTTTGGSITYCASKGTSVTYEWIKQIMFGTINNTSNSNGGYGNFTNLSTNVTAGSTYTLTFKPGYSGSTYREYWTVYIDYNQNGTLNNTGETVVQVSTTSVNGGTANITIPTTAKSGPTRMRIQMHYGSQITNPCTTFNYGEVEDYTINISGGTGITSSTLNGPQDVTTNKLASIIIAPNPIASSNAQTIYRLADNGNTVMKVIDLDGRILKTIQLGTQIAGEHVYNIGLDKIATGNYILILEQKAKIIARTSFVVTR